MEYLKTDEYLYEVGNKLLPLFLTVAGRLENGKAGSRFPLFSINLGYNGRVEYADLDKFIEELKIICIEFDTIKLQDVIMDEEGNCFKCEADEENLNALYYFADKFGFTLFEALYELCLTAEEHKTPIEIHSTAMHGPVMYSIEVIFDENKDFGFSCRYANIPCADMNYLLCESNVYMSLFDNVCKHLENGKWGTKYKLVMNDLYNKKVKYANLDALKSELDDIKQAFTKIGQKQLVWKYPKVLAYTQAYESIKNKSIYDFWSVFYCDKNMFELIEDAINKAKENNNDLTIEFKHIHTRFKLRYMELLQKNSD